MKQQSHWVSVKSSRISALRFNPSTLVLEVRFKNGRVYKFSPVTISSYDTLITSTSIGKAFETLIANNPKLTFEEISE